MNEFFEYINQNKNVKYIYDFVKDKVSEKDSTIKIDYFDNHILICAYYAYVLAQMHNADCETVVIGALLHDYGRIKKEWTKQHEIYGAIEAIKILSNINYDTLSSYCIADTILNHKVGKKKKLSLEAQIVADADAISYIKKIDYFINYLVSCNLETEEIMTVISLKIKENYDKMSVLSFDLVQKDVEKIKEKGRDIKWIM